MYQPTVVAGLVEMRQEEVRQLAAGSRGAGAKQASGAGLRQRASLCAGAALIAAGRRLREPYEPTFDGRANGYRV